MNFSDLPTLVDKVKNHPLKWDKKEQEVFYREYDDAIVEYKERLHKGNYDDVLFKAIEGARALERDGRFHLVLDALLLPEHLRQPNEDYVVMKSSFSTLLYVAQFAGERYMDAWGR